jgi:hypothetical protein
VNSVLSFFVCGGIAYSVMLASPLPFLIGISVAAVLALVSDAIHEVKRSFRASAARRRGSPEENSRAAAPEQLEGLKERQSLTSFGSQPIWGD